MAWEEALDMCTSCTAMELLRLGKIELKKPTSACLLTTSSHAFWGPYDFIFKTISQV
ncbi:hypothetical protein NC652_011194 [Populus alba x Populus x berolinensis]|nr:hypothetical protein NC652_011194 [Populus alba x Populus x berolinensis]